LQAMQDVNWTESQCELHAFDHPSHEELKKKGILCSSMDGLQGNVDAFMEPGASIVARKRAQVTQAPIFTHAKLDLAQASASFPSF
jgi:hypothetical protein